LIGFIGPAKAVPLLQSASKTSFSAGCSAVPQNSQQKQGFKPRGKMPARQKHPSAAKAVSLRAANRHG
jgi:hypothetical protein